MIHKQFLEDLGITVPDEASRFYTENTCIFFQIPFLDEYGYSIVIQEETVEYELTEKQIEELKASNHFGTTGWTLI